MSLQFFQLVEIAQHSSVVNDAISALYMQSSEEGSDSSGDPPHFFGVPAYLTVSGQLHAEALAWCVTLTVATTLLQWWPLNDYAIQLTAETALLLCPFLSCYSALSKVYTFGPTFRADLTHTRRHLSEFYMVEAEVCFTEGLGDILDIIEDMYKSVTTSLLRECEEDIDLLHRAAASADGIKVPQTVTSTWPRLWAT